MKKNHRILLIGASLVLVFASLIGVIAKSKNWFVTILCIIIFGMVSLLAKKEIEEISDDNDFFN